MPRKTAAVFSTAVLNHTIHMEESHVDGGGGNGRYKRPVRRFHTTQLMRSQGARTLYGMQRI